MKQAPQYYPSNPETIEAYQPDDIETNAPVFKAAEEIWLENWKDQGSKDEGTCCLGKGIQIWYIGKRKRSAKPYTVIQSPPCQGNVSAYRSVEPALAFLKEQGISNVKYFDGYMD